MERAAGQGHECAGRQAIVKLWDHNDVLCLKPLTERGCGDLGCATMHSVTALNHGRDTSVLHRTLLLVAVEAHFPCSTIPAALPLLPGACEDKRCS